MLPAYTLSELLMREHYELMKGGSEFRDFAFELEAWANRARELEENEDLRAHLAGQWDCPERDVIDWINEHEMDSEELKRIRNNLDLIPSDEVEEAVAELVRFRKEVMSILNKDGADSYDEVLARLRDIVEERKHAKADRDAFGEIARLLRDRGLA